MSTKQHILNAQLLATLIQHIHAKQYMRTLNNAYSFTQADAPLILSINHLNKHIHCLAMSNCLNHVFRLFVPA